MTRSTPNRLEGAAGAEGEAAPVPHLAEIPAAPTLLRRSYRPPGGVLAVILHGCDFGSGALCASPSEPTTARGPGLLAAAAKQSTVDPVVACRVGSGKAIVDLRMQSPHRRVPAGARKRALGGLPSSHRGD